MAETLQSLMARGLSRQRAKNTLYWMERARQNDQRTEAQKEEAIRQLQESFDDTEEIIKGRLEHFYNKYAEEGIVTPAEANIRLTPDEIDTLRRYIDKLVTKTITPGEKKTLLNFRARINITRQEALLVEMKHYVTELTTKTGQIMEGTLHEIFSEEELRQWYNLEQFTGFQVDFTRMSESQLQALIHAGYDGRDFSEKIWYDRDVLVGNIYKIIPRQFTLGSSVDKLAKELAKEMKTSRYNAKRLIRTEGTKLASDADMHLYTGAGLAEYEFYATLDDVTTEWCRDLDGKVFLLKDAQTGVNLPPIHNNCRSTTLPVVDMDGLEETRLAKDENGKYITVPKQTYREWEAGKAG